MPESIKERSERGEDMLLLNLSPAPLPEERRESTPICQVEIGGLVRAELLAIGFM